VKVQVREIKDPLGRLRNSNLVRVPTAVGVVPPEGMPVTLQPDPLQFGLPGEYKVVLFIEGKRASDQSAVHSLLELVLRRPEAQINLDELKDWTIDLTRRWPGGTVSGTVLLYL